MVCSKNKYFKRLSYFLPFFAALEFILYIISQDNFLKTSIGLLIMLLVYIGLNSRINNIFKHILSTYIYFSIISIIYLIVYSLVAIFL